MIRLNFIKFSLSMISLFSSVCAFGQQSEKKETDSLPQIKIVGATKIYSADKSFNDQLKNSNFFLKNNEVTYKTDDKVDSLIGASTKERNYKVIKRNLRLK